MSAACGAAGCPPPPGCHRRGGPKEGDTPWRGVLPPAGQSVPGDPPPLPWGPLSCRGHPFPGDCPLRGPPHPAMLPPARGAPGQEHVRGSLLPPSCALKIGTSSRAHRRGRTQPLRGAPPGTGGEAGCGGGRSLPRRWPVGFSPRWGAARSWRRPTVTRWSACCATSPTSTPACSTATTTSAPAACGAAPATAAYAARSAGKGRALPVGTPGPGVGLSWCPQSCPCHLYARPIPADTPQW